MPSSIGQPGVRFDLGVVAYCFLFSLLVRSSAVQNALACEQITDSSHGDGFGQNRLGMGIAASPHQGPWLDSPRHARPQHE